MWVICNSGVVGEHNIYAHKQKYKQSMLFDIELKQSNAS